MKQKTKNIIEFIRKIYDEDKQKIPLHSPIFLGNEKKYLSECIDTSFVSSVGRFVNEFEKMIVTYTKSKYAIAVSNGTSAIHIALLVAGVKKDEEVITQALSFVATANAIKHANAEPVFIDVDKNTMGMSPESLSHFLENNTEQKQGACYNIKTGKKISACIPVHIFGNPCEIDSICDICKLNNIVVIEDAAESIGSKYKDKHTGTYGLMGILSFNGNKTISCGGGGIILTNDKELAKTAKHITTTAKVPHRWEYIHDIVGYNYRLTNLNAAVGVAQLEKIDHIINNKRKLAKTYNHYFKENNISFLTEKENSESNYWLNAIILNDRDERDFFLEETNNQGIETRPIWRLLNDLEMYKQNQQLKLFDAEYLQERVVCIPSSYNKNLEL
jgi:perosamine synthetase